MKFFRISGAAYNTPQAAFSGMGASKADHRWSWGRPTTRAVYVSDTLSLACLECLVHIRPLPRIFAPSVYYTIDLPEEVVERPERSALPRGWDAPIAPAAARDFGMEFLQANRAVALILPTAILPEGLNALVNPQHPGFQLSWVRGPFVFKFDTRLT